NSPEFHVSPHFPVAPVLLEGSQSTKVGQSFGTMKVGYYDQYGNPIPLKVSARIDGEINDQGSTGGDFYSTNGPANFVWAVPDVNGEATLPALTANGVPGTWKLTLGGEGTDLTTEYQMSNLTGDAATMTLSLSPTLVPADGVSEVNATIQLTDQFDNPVAGDQVDLSSDGTQGIGPVTDHGDGSYIGLITASTKAGQFTITATDSSVGTSLSKSADLTQTALAPETITLTLSLANLPADGKSTTKAEAVVQDRFGNAVPDTQVAFASDGGQSIGPVSEISPGSFSSTITASKAAGSSQISASLIGANPAVSAGQTLQQTTVKVIKPKLKFTKKPKKKVKAKKVKFKFKVTKGKAKSFQCKLDKKKWSKCKSPKKIKLKKGKHVFKVRGVATDGSFGKTLKYKVKRVG
ncbi:MAG: Ig-like domain-containing protein, partial [Solirubrobacterales bacterium]